MPKKSKSKTIKTKKSLSPKSIRELLPSKYLKSLAVALTLIFSIIFPGRLIYTLYTPPPSKQVIATEPLQEQITPVLGLADYPLSDGAPAPVHSAISVIVQDYNSKVILYEKDPDRPMIPASTTKIMTALIAIETYTDLKQVVRITNEHLAIGHSMGLQPNELITIENLLYGVLIESGNDAAFALANNFPGGYDAFILRMNERARELSLTSTSYLNPSGVEQVGHHTSVRDLAILASYASENPLFSRIMGTKSITVTDVNGTIVHHLTNTNELLGNLEGVIGMKTGWTENAGECLVTLTDRGGRKIITVVLGSENRFFDTQNIIEWAYSHHTWQNLDIELSSDTL